MSGLPGDGVSSERCRGPQCPGGAGQNVVAGTETSVFVQTTNVPQTKTSSQRMEGQNSLGERTVNTTQLGKKSNNSCGLVIILTGPFSGSTSGSRTVQLDFEPYLTSTR